MKVRYIKNHTDEFGQYFPIGCVAEHPDSEGQARIALGVAEETNKNAFSRRLPPEQAVSLECVPSVADEGTALIVNKKSK